MFNESVSGKENELLLDPDTSNNILIPVDIFNTQLSGLEAISKYLKEDANLRFSEIGAILNRDERTVWGAYNRSRQKMPSSFEIEDSVKIPISLFRNRNLSVLENIAWYMKEELNLRYCKIAIMLNKDDRTIWTVCQRAKRKNYSYSINNEAN